MMCRPGTPRSATLRTRKSRFLGLCIAIAGCSAEATDPTTSTTTGVHTTTGDLPEPTWNSATGTPGSDSSTDSNEPTEPTTTTGHNPSSTTSVPDFGDQNLGCNGKIDFLFVIDREQGMHKYWPKFWAAFPSFIEDVLETFANFDLHFMVVDGYGSMTADVSGWGMNECIEPCADNGTCYPTGPEDYPCEAYEDGILDTCGMKGAGIVFPAGFEAANRDCGVVGGRRYVDSREQPDLEETVKCISKLGYGYASSRPEVSMLWSVSPDEKPADCNQGFLRDDALLVIVYYSYVGHESVEGPPGLWAEKLYTLKGGDQDKLAVIGIIDDGSYDEEIAVCPPGDGFYWETSAAFLHFYIKHKVEGSLCATDYAPYLDAGIELVADLCDAEIPT